MITIPTEHMRQMDISFCGKVATNIVTSDAKQAIIDNFNKLIESKDILTPHKIDMKYGKGYISQKYYFSQ